MYLLKFSHQFSVLLLVDLSTAVDKADHLLYFPPLGSRAAFIFLSLCLLLPTSLGHYFFFFLLQDSFLSFRYFKVGVHCRALGNLSCSLLISHSLKTLNPIHMLKTPKFTSSFPFLTPLFVPLALLRYNLQIPIIYEWIN